MISTRDAIELRRANLPGGAGDQVLILQQPDGRVLLKRFVNRGGVLNVVDRYERATADGTEVARLDFEVANQIVDALLADVPWSAALVVGEVADAAPVTWVRSEAEKKYTSVGNKFFTAGNRAAMDGYRLGNGRSVISTHVSPEGACDIRCPFCSVTGRETHSRIALPRIKQYVTDLKSRGLKAVTLTGGGQPTLYPEFNELVQWLKAQDLSVALITNGTINSSGRVHPATWKCFSWVRVSINIFEHWRSKIWIPREQLAEDCVVGCSVVSTVEHEATVAEVPLDRLELFRQFAEVADKLGAEYIRVLPNCLLPQRQLLLEHRTLDKLFEQLGDPRFFHQFKVHGAPRADRCHQARLRPYLSEEPYQGEGPHHGEPGSVYPCDSVVLNDSAAHFAGKYQLCPPEGVLDFMDGKIGENFSPKKDCSGCVFTGNVNRLEDWAERGEGEFTEEKLVHEEFV